MARLESSSYRPSVRRSLVPNVVTLRQAPRVQARARAPETPSRHAPAPHEFPAWEAADENGSSLHYSINPADLWRELAVAPFVRISFPDEKALKRFRVNLYKVNVEGKFRYSTRREGWTGLVILRLK